MIPLSYMDRANSLTKSIYLFSATFL